MTEENRPEKLTVKDLKSVSERCNNIDEGALGNLFQISAWSDLDIWYLIEGYKLWYVLIPRHVEFNGTSQAEIRETCRGVMRQW